MRNGYDPNFLDGIEVSLPSPGLKLKDDVLIPEGFEHTNGVIPYINYSVLMSKTNKQALYSAANLDQNSFRQVSGRDWFVDTRVGSGNQIDNRAYRRNPWDRGHLTRRTAVTWGNSDYIARKASNDSCAYTNATLQHENFNQDEWRVPEKLVQKFHRDIDGRLCVFTGSIFTVYDRWYSRRSLAAPVRIPSGFWKLVAYKSADTRELECQAYVMFQDALFNLNKEGQEGIQVKSYQVTTTELEYWTGLEFSEALYHANPLKFYPSENHRGPESVAIPSTDRDGEPIEPPVFTVGDIQNAGIIARRREMAEQDFYDFVEELSWI